MSLYKIEQARARKRTGTFHYDTIKSAKQRKEEAETEPFFGRLTKWVTSTVLGGLAGYVALHYVPAYLPVAGLMALTKADAAAVQIQASQSEPNVLERLQKQFQLRRSYVRAGQAINARYIAPKGSAIDLQITRCKPALFIEVFKCVPVNTQTVSITDETIGTQAIFLKRGGFYQFDAQVSREDGSFAPYSVAWSRS